MSKRNLILAGAALLLIATGVIIAVWGGDGSGSSDNGSTTAGLVAVFVAVFVAIYASRSSKGGKD